jgi:hypothetical protein
VFANFGIGTLEGTTQMPAKTDWPTLERRRHGMEQAVKVAIAVICGALLLAVVLLVMQVLPVSTR